jgi:hypothetical protein
MTTALQAWAAALDGWIEEIASSDADQDIVSAGAGFRRDAAFRRLIDQWIDAGGENLAWWFRSVLDSTDSTPYVEKPQSAPGAESELLLVHYRAGFPPGHTSTVIQVASPSPAGNGPWVRRGLEITDPTGCSFELDAFSGAAWRKQLAGTFSAHSQAAPFFGADCH